MSISGLVEFIPSAVGGTGTFGSTIANLSDNDLTNQASFTDAYQDMGIAARAVALLIVPRPTSGVDYAKRSANWKLQASTDNATWVDVLSIASVPPSYQNRFNKFSVDAGGKSYRYWRLVAAAIGRHTALTRTG